MSRPRPLATRPTLDSRSHVARLRLALGAVGAVVLGAAPHVLHHVGPLAGAALLAGTSGKLLFGALGLLLAVPMLRRLRVRTGSWRVPAALLGVMAAMFTLSTLVIAPALTEQETGPSKPTPVTVPDTSGDGHESHHGG